MGWLVRQNFSRWCGGSGKAPAAERPIGNLPPNSDGKEWCPFAAATGGAWRCTGSAWSGPILDQRRCSFSLDWTSLLAARLWLKSRIGINGADHGMVSQDRRTVKGPCKVPDETRTSFMGTKKSKGKERQLQGTGQDSKEACGNRHLTVFAHFCHDNPVIADRPRQVLPGGGGSIPATSPS